MEFEPVDLDQSCKTNIAHDGDNNDDGNNDDGNNDDNNDDDNELPRPVIILINLKTLLPIAKDETDNKLYAFLPETDINFPSSFVSTTNPNVRNRKLKFLVYNYILDYLFYRLFHPILHILFNGYVQWSRNRHTSQFIFIVNMALMNQQ